MNAGIYRIVVNRPNAGAKYYLGQASNLVVRRSTHLTRLRSGSHRNRHLQRAYDRYGEEAFAFQTLLICAADKDVLTMYEQAILQSYPRSAVYNIQLECVGSSLGVKRSAETIEKKRIAAKGNASRTGKPHSDASKAKMSLASRAAVAREEPGVRAARAMGNKGNRGRKFTDEHKARIGAASRCTVKTPEWREKIAATMKARGVSAQRERIAGRFAPRIVPD